MRSMWIRIGLGALAVFVVGSVAARLVRRARDTVKLTINGDSPIPIPLAGMVPFRLDGAELGSLRRLEFLRSSPSEISGVRVVVRLAGDSIDATKLSDCQIGLRSLDNLNARTSFTCLASDSGLEQFGFVYLSGQHDSLPLYLPTDAVKEIRAMHLEFGQHRPPGGHPEGAVVVEVNADSIRQAVAAELKRAAAELEKARESMPPPPAAPAPSKRP